MAKHKAATEVSISAYEEPSLLQVWVAKYWKMAAIAVVVISAAILFRNYRNAAKTAAVEARWDALSAGIESDPFSGRIRTVTEKLEEALPKVAGTNAEPWALLGLVSGLVEDGDYPGAKETLEKLKGLNLRDVGTDHYTLGPGGESTTLLAWMEDMVERQGIWEESHPGLLENPALPEGSPRVRIVTGEGDIVVGLFQEKAPEHVENFLKLCREGFYDGTKFHRVVAGFMIQGGDPNTKQVDFATWGQGGPGYKVSVETNDLYHFEGVLAAAKMPGETESSGSQFYITTGTPHHLDGQHVVYGTVIEGMDVVKDIEGGAIEDPQTARPEKPVEILNTEIF